VWVLFFGCKNRAAKYIQKEAVITVLVFMLNWVPLFLLIASAHPTDKLLTKLISPPGPVPNNYL
jgi:hypothetical protein